MDMVKGLLRFNAPAVSVNVEDIVSALFNVTPAALFTFIPAKVNAAEPLMVWGVVPLKVIVPAAGVNVPLLAKSPLNV